jgi:hypothetical protein
MVRKPSPVGGCMTPCLASSGSERLSACRFVRHLRVGRRRQCRLGDGAEDLYSSVAGISIGAL